MREEACELVFSKISKYCFYKPDGESDMEGVVIDELGIDSMQLITLLFEIERELEVPLPNNLDQVGSSQKVSVIVDVVEKMLKEKITGETV